ncbi:TylF/MycF/NovP-related O-methyltransferase [Nannocystis sp.]|uniref:TylF/MycF/NovP-related O-methyltransferase n=1 Tax=Nannocystis sp. TaxID=1962667 RepID=UPI0025D1EFC7|nr:TylF/MycF/NovP-related O-methyltransferase [Nannocystis sp.]MBK7824530.1 class I SAM-dependent methyltransferase [Nannocystis sp.]
MQRVFKTWLTRIGAHVSARAIHRVNAALNYLEVGRWMAAQGFDTSRRVIDRHEIYAQIASELGEQRVLYLEFGVHRGESMRMWSQLLRHPDSQLHGFDSFEGLPEDWTVIDGKGTFSTGGAEPVLSDRRVRFFRGWFADTLPGYTPPAHERLVLHLDADLYSSTKTVLDALEREIVPGSFVLFDEFSDRLHELRAFDEFLRAHPQWRFRLVAADQILARVAFERVS